MIRPATFVLAFVTAIGCGKGAGTKPTPGSGSTAKPVVTAEATPIDAARPVPVDDLVPIQTEEPPDALVGEAYAKTVKLSAGRCHDAPPETLNSSYSGVAKLDDASVLGVTCGDGDKDMWTIAVAKSDGKTVTILGAKNITAGQLQLHKDLRASPTRRCIQYDTIDGFVMIKGFEFCAPVNGTTTTAAPDDSMNQPTKVLPPVPAPDGVVDQATTTLIGDTYTCSNATRQPVQANLAVMDGDGMILALTCGDADTHDMVIGLLQQQKSGAMQMLAYTIDLGTDRDEITRIRSDTSLICVDYTRRPRGQNNVFCVRRSP